MEKGRENYMETGAVWGSSHKARPSAFEGLWLL